MRSNTTPNKPDNVPPPLLPPKEVVSSKLTVPPAMLISAADLSREFGGISTRTIRRLDQQGRLPRPIRVGRAVRWRRTEIVAWVAAGGPPRNEWTWEGR